VTPTAPAEAAELEELRKALAKARKENTALQVRNWILAAGALHSLYQ
jgi:hypothetical protein